MITLGELQELVKDPYFWAQTKTVFFEAMSAGYAATEKLKKGTVPELHGSKLMPPYIRKPWIVTDVYLMTQLSNRSGGMTVISYEGVLVWMMQYFGEYNEVAIPCLKAALRDAYAAKEFIGGRGTNRFQYQGFTYCNNPVLMQFELFFGRETVYETRAGSRPAGWHSYQGGKMC